MFLYPVSYLCPHCSVRPVIEIASEGVVNKESSAALDAALTYVSERYSDQAPPPDLPRRTELVTPEGVVGFID